MIQEIPYIVMPIFKPAANPIMSMTNEIKCIETVQGIFGILSMILLMLIVGDDVKLGLDLQSYLRMCISRMNKRGG